MIRSFIVSAVMVGLVSVGLAGGLSASTVAAAPQFGEEGDTCSRSFLTFPTWYRGLDKDVDKSGKAKADANGDPTCAIGMPSANDGTGGVQTFVFKIVLNLIEIALQLVGYAAVGFIIYGGFKYLTSAGSADRVTAGRKIIQNAVIGLVISFFSVAIVNLIASNIK